MRFVSHFSSSDGNLYECKADNGKRILLEAGVSMTKLREAIGYDWTDIEGAFATHAHMDHCRVLPDVARMGIDVYAGKETFEAVLPGLMTHRMHLLTEGVSVKTASFIVMPFSCIHDVPCFGFIVKEIATGEYLLFATDTARITHTFMHNQVGVRRGEPQRCRIPFSIVAVACNFDTDRLDEMVKSEYIHEALAIRLLGSHPSKQGLQAYLRDHCDLSRCRCIHLLHMSGTSIDQEATRKEFEEMFLVTTYTSSPCVAGGAAP